MAAARVHAGVVAAAAAPAASMPVDSCSGGCVACPAVSLGRRPAAAAGPKGPALAGRRSRLVDQRCCSTQLVCRAVP